MPSLVIVARPVSVLKPPYLLLEKDDTLSTFDLIKGRPISFTFDTTTKHCTGWYDIETHQNHLCTIQSTIDNSYESCYACRQKTNFNPAFYNTSNISEKQAKYNKAPHTVYIAYFGNNLAKAGIMSDSRGLERLYEQGALFYAIAAQCSNATQAHNVENQLIQKGLRNSVTKKQKADTFLNTLDLKEEQVRFMDILENVELRGVEIIRLIDTFFYGDYPRQPIRSIEGNSISGKITGVVGRYLILENNERFYGFWLNNLFGYKVTIDDQVNLMEREPEQISLF
jgi:hypothetical protein